MPTMQVSSEAFVNNSELINPNFRHLSSIVKRPANEKKTIVPMETNILKFPEEYFRLCFYRQADYASKKKVTRNNNNFICAVEFGR